MSNTTQEQNPVNGQKLSKWGYSFTWTDQHFSPARLNPLRQQYDELGSAAYERLSAIRKSQESGASGNKKDLYVLLRDNYQSDPVLTRFWKEVHDIPDWVDWTQLARGQEVFHRYIGANLVGFALHGFVGDNSASNGVVEVLVRTGGFSTRVLLHRVFETFQWLLQCTEDLAAVQPGGEGHAATIRVRLLHSAVRQRILALVATRPEYFDVARYGVPVNTTDSLHSIATFCASPMWFHLPPQGVRPRPQEAADYAALFRWIAHVIGAPTAPFATAEGAKAVMDSIFYYELSPAASSRVVSHNFIECLRDVPPMNISRGFIEAGSRWTNGHELCDAIGLARPGWYYHALFAGHCMLVCTLCWAQRACPPFDRYMIESSRKGFRRFLMNGSVMKVPSVFDFKWVPHYGKLTAAEDGLGTGKVNQPGAKPPSIDRWIERIYFRIFVAGCLIVGVTVSALVRLLPLSLPTIV